MQKKINELARKLMVQDPSLTWPKAQKKAKQILSAEVQKKVTRLHIGGKIRIVHI